MCNRLTKLSVTMWYTFFGIFDDTSLWILPKMHDPSLCDTPDVMCPFSTISNFEEQIKLKLFSDSEIKDSYTYP